MKTIRLWPTAALAVLLLSLPGCGQKQTPDVPGARTETNAVPDAPAEMTAPEEEEITGSSEADAEVPADEPAEEENPPEEGLLTVDGVAYRLTFEDNFDGDSLDGTKWSLCPEWDRQDVGGAWRNSETSVHDGELWLRARIDDDGTPVSGAVRTLGHFEQAYGYFEARILWPSTTGFWGAFWMMCGDVGKEDGSAVSGAEIDIIESGECARRGVNHAIHWDGYGSAHKSVSKILSRVPELYEGWHTYGLRWTEEAYIFYIDGEETWRTSEPGICEKPGYMKLTTEFGSWAAPIVPEELPDCCRVDWVRAWEEAE